jgi:hypothetical protein
MRYRKVYVEYNNITSSAYIIRKIDVDNYYVFVDSISKIVILEKKFIKDLDKFFV